jgi:hypothetical protein
MVQWFKQEKNLSGGVNFEDEENMPEDENGQVDLNSAGGPKAVGRRPPLSMSVGIGDIADLIDDLAQALDKTVSSSRGAARHEGEAASRSQTSVSALKFRAISFKL